MQPKHFRGVKGYSLGTMSKFTFDPEICARKRDPDALRISMIVFSGPFPKTPRRKPHRHRKSVILRRPQPPLRIAPADP